MNNPPLGTKERVTDVGNSPFVGVGNGGWGLVIELSICIENKMRK